MVAEPITIREAVLDDVPFLRKMMWEAISASPTLMTRLGDETIQRRETAYWDGWLIRPDPAFLAVDLNGRVAGAIVLQPDNGEGPGWRIGIGVEADVRGHGIGTRLIERALAFARAGGATYVNLSVDPVNTRAVALYHRLGFAETGAQNGMVLMRKVV